MVYEDIFDAKNAVTHLSGFNVKGRYIVVLFYQQDKMTQRMGIDKKREQLDALQAKYGVDDRD